MSRWFAGRAAPAFVAALFIAAGARADAADGKARELQAAGLKALKAKAYAEAIRDFQDAYALDQHALLLGMISRAQLELGDCGEAVGSARQFVAVAAPEDAASARRLAGQVLDQCVQVTVQTDPPAAELFIDGKPQHPTPWIGWLRAGDHSLLVKRAGREQTQPLPIPAGRREPILVAITLPKLPEATPAAKAPPAPALAAPIVAAVPLRAAGAAPPEAVRAPRAASYAPPAASDALFVLAGAGAAIAIAEGVQTDKCMTQVTNPAQLPAAAGCQSTHAKVANFAWLGAGVAAAAGGVVWIVHATSGGEQHGVAIAGRF